MAKDKGGHGSEKRGTAGMTSTDYAGLRAHEVSALSRAEGNAGMRQARADMKAKLAEQDATRAASSGEAHVKGIADQHGIGTGHLVSASNPGYNRDAVNNAIASSNRSGRKIGGKEAAAIHRLLRGY